MHRETCTARDLGLIQRAQRCPWGHGDELPHALRTPLCAYLAAHQSVCAEIAQVRGCTPTCRCWGRFAAACGYSGDRGTPSRA